ncbi:MAG: hypothetical protein IJ111_01225 [Eggerthellaceae bacterium]|nr:hypothetical protein [Eggerthellaceae bacterium]
MTLFLDMTVPCVRLYKLVEKDGEGGHNVRWIDGAPFKAAIHRENTLNARVAEKDGMTDVYTVTVNPETSLPFHSVFKRLSDGKTFRTTSDTADRHTPTMSTFQFARVAAEEWELPQDDA